jgi:hypothetical protein
MLIESPGFVVLCVNAERADARNVRSLDCAKHSVFEKTGTKFLALPVGRDRQTCKQHDGDGMTGHAFLQALGGIVTLNLSNHKGVISGNLCVRHGNVDLRRFGLLVLQGKAQIIGMEEPAPAQPTRGSARISIRTPA